jgi:hypothetical protein
MAERAVALIGFVLAFVGLLGGIIFRTEGLTICVIGLIMMLFGLFFDDEF